MKTKFFSSLYWRIGATFLLVLVILSVVYTYIAVFTAEMYFQEAHQKLNANVAEHIAKDTPNFVNGKVNEAVLKDVFHNIMVINPSLEVYLLDTKGKILTYFAPNKTITLDYIPIEPIRKFIETKGNEFLLGPDPRHPDAEKAFSAAEAYEGKTLCGYIYVVLGSEEYENSFHLVYGSYILRLGVRSIIITLIASAIISLFALGFITRHLRRILRVIRDFKDGNLKARIKNKGKGELREFSDSFNDMADTIVQNMEEMRTMDNLRRELVANVSHDLRTPLATIQGYLETILMKSDKLTDDEKERYLSVILKGTKRLKKLVDELFELSKLEARESKPKPEAFSIAELVQDVQRKNLIIAEKKEIEFGLNLNYDLPLVYADIGMMERVIQNLLDNAFKFTPAGGSVEILLKQENDSIIVTVKDSGRGINEEDLPHIFDRFHRTQKNQSNDDGLGLGLAIVKKILEVHHINIDVESKEGEGTEFSFNIPVFKQRREKETPVPAHS